MIPLSQQLKSKYLTEILNTTPRVCANEEQGKLKEDIEATKTQSPYVFPRWSSILNIPNRKLPNCHTLAKFHHYFKRCEYILFQDIQSTETRKLPRKYVIDQGENPVLFLLQKYFPHKSHVHNYIYSLKWCTPRVSHTPPIDSNESLMARTANSFFQNTVGGSNFYFNSPRVVRKTEKQKKKKILLHVWKWRRYGICVLCLI